MSASVSQAALAMSALQKRTLVAGSGWSVSEITCDAGPGDRPFEERHEGYSIAAVVAGAFTYRGERGEAAMFPGALLLGNHDRCFSCGHAHSRGDRCIAFSLAPETFAEIAASAAGTSRYSFSVNVAPPGHALTPALVGLERLARESCEPRREERALGLAERLIGLVSGHSAAPPRASARELRRIVEAVRAIDARPEAALDLAALAATAGFSKYHFLRVFRRVVGMTPHQYLIATRLRRASARLSDTKDSVTRIAFDSGFGDLSTFNARFRAVFGVAPSAWRRKGGA
ncbi:MAG: AraC family transcriptional regulator [Bradyrhizobium sp.]|nr:MAG: AraC family transcriptional regulator [Bradyrhizobium sp.]